MREEPHTPVHEETPHETLRGTARLSRGLVVLATLGSALVVTSGTAVTISLLGT